MLPYISDPNTSTKELVRILASVYPDRFQIPSDSCNGRVLLRRTLCPDRVNVIVSSGGGCHPLSYGYLGEGMADACINGNQRCAPSAYDIYEAALKIGSLSGNLLIYNNYMGDYLNNDLAVELLSLENIPCRLCPATDDCLSAPPDVPRSERGGLIGMLYLIKIAASCAESGLSLEETARISRKANERMSTLAVTMDYDRELIHLGAGFSGEPPVSTHSDRFSMDGIADLSYDVLCKDLKPSAREKIYMMVSRMTLTHPEDAYILAGYIKQVAASRYPITRINAGFYTNLFHAQGFLITFLCADQELEQYLHGSFYSDTFSF